jgi:hypothetical protein
MNDRALIPDPTAAERAAAVIAGAGDEYTKGVLVPFSIRVPVWVVAVLDAMATRTGRSRNYVLNLVLAAGIDEIQRELPEEIRQELAFLANDAQGKAMELPGNVSGQVL